MAPPVALTTFVASATFFVSHSATVASFAASNPSPSNGPLQLRFPDVPVAHWPEQNGLGKREASDSSDETNYTCALQCLSHGDFAGCVDVNDGNCLCQSQPFLSRMSACLAVTCTSAQQWNDAYFYVRSYCSVFQVALPYSSVSLVPTLVYGTAPTTASTATIAADGTAPRATVYYTRTKATITVDIVMGSICSFLLAIAFATGGYNIYQLYKVEQTQSQLGSRPFTQAGTQMSHVKSYNNFEFNPTRTNATGRSAFAVGPSAGGNKRSHNLTHLDATAFSSFPAVTPRDDKIHVHTATTINSTSSSGNPGGFPHGGGIASGSSVGDAVPLSGDSTIHINDEMSTLPVLKRISGQSVHFSLEEDDDSDKDVESKDRKFSNRDNRI